MRASPWGAAVILSLLAAGAIAHNPPAPHLTSQATASTPKAAAHAPSAAPEVHTKAAPPKVRVHMPEVPRTTRPVHMSELRLRSPVDWASPGHTIRSYAIAGTAAQAQPLIDQGKAVDYLNGHTIAGHNYMGWAWFATVADGTHVTVDGGPLAGNYIVTGHYYTTADIWPTGLNATLILQSCLGPGTGFSTLRKD